MARKRSTGGDDRTAHLIGMTQLAEMIGKDRGTISEWVAKGCPVARQGSTGARTLLDPRDVFAWRETYARSDEARKFARRAEEAGENQMTVAELNKLEDIKLKRQKLAMASKILIHREPLGMATRPVGLPVIELLEPPLPDSDSVFLGTAEGKSLIGFPKLWIKLLKGSALEGITPHVLRHSFASIANDLGFTETTIAALVGHSRGTITSRYILTIDTALVMAADAVAGYICGLLDGVEFRRTSYVLDRESRQAAMDRLFEQTLSAVREAEAA